MVTRSVKLQCACSGTTIFPSKSRHSATLSAAVLNYRKRYAASCRLCVECLHCQPSQSWHVVKAELMEFSSGCTGTAKVFLYVPHCSNTSQRPKVQGARMQGATQQGQDRGATSQAPSHFGSAEALAFNSNAAANFGQDLSTLVRPHPQHHQLADFRSIAATSYSAKHETASTASFCPAELRANFQHTPLATTQLLLLLLHGREMQEQVQQCQTLGVRHSLANLPMVTGLTTA